MGLKGVSDMQKKELCILFFDRDQVRLPSTGLKSVHEYITDRMRILHPFHRSGGYTYDPYGCFLAVVTFHKIRQIYRS